MRFEGEKEAVELDRELGVAGSKSIRIGLADSLGEGAKRER